ncbi:hypothetical protein DP939_00130 [Spongiactinospora rosea]|uniref:LysM domain-containing protein n=1 Tax=Spongiactinospora rosea TaxID=2248750 RepID=A0A366M4S2_9ACTN|nr:BTAD domain-containing putative transcriptional regulator [Spongiactinospora rosea]RBQ21185.1 hypothetical protein DP939_00130 [Spongiactinospora rosea]
MTVYRLVRSVAAIAVLIAAVAGFPILLYSLAGSPLPDHLPGLGQITDTLAGRDDGTAFLAVLELLAWGTWACFTASVAVEIGARARGLRLTPRLPGLGGMQRLAAYLVTSAFLAIGSPVTAPASAATTAPPVTAMAPAHPLDAEETYRVRSGDTLWKIADEKLGNPRRWPRLWKLNAGSAQPRGAHFADPDHIRPGWRLRLPERNRAVQAAPVPRTSDGFERAPRVYAEVASQEDSGVELPSGSLIALSYVAGISTAYALQRHLRRRHRVPPAASEGVTITLDPEPEPAVRNARRAHRRALAERGQTMPSDSELIQQGYSIDVPSGIAIARRPDNSAISIALAGLNLALTGPGGHDTARHLITGLLQQASNLRAEVLLPRSLADSLFGPLIAIKVPGLLVTESAEQAIAKFEETYLGRSRMLLEREATDIDELRERDPGEPLPGLLLVIEPSPGVDERIKGPLTSGARRTGIGALLLGVWPNGTTCHIADDHQISTTGPLTGTQAFHITKEEAAAYLRTLSPPPPPTTTAVPLPQPEPAAYAGPHLVRLTLIGPPTVSVRDRPNPLELTWIQLNTLAYLALYPTGVTRDQLATALWPDETGKDIHNTLRHLRNALVTATGHVNQDLRRAPFINASTTKNTAVYRIDTGLISVDVWDYQAALAEAKAAPDLETRIAALTKATDLCHGQLAQGLETEWIDDHRYPLTRSQADTLCQYAELITDRAPEQALEALERARTLDPDTEDVYLRIIALQVHLNRRDDAHRTAQLLRRHNHNLGIPTGTRTENHIGRLLRNDHNGPAHH